MMDLLSCPLCPPTVSPSLSMSNPDEQMDGGEKKKRVGVGRGGGMPACCAAITLSISPPAPFPSCSFLSCQHFSLLYLNLAPHIVCLSSLCPHICPACSGGVISQSIDLFDHLSDHPFLPTTTGQFAVKFTVYSP